MVFSLYQILVLCFLVAFIFPNCSKSDEVSLWGECYNVHSTTKLNVSGSGLTGEIPSQIGSLVNLYTIDLSNNRLTGEIPK